MVKKILPPVTLVLLALALLAGCDQLPGVEGAAIIGSINIDPYAEAMFGGAEFHVLLFSAGTDVNPYTAGEVDAVVPVARYDGAFPGTISDYYWTTNYTIADVPEGEYFALVWIDQDESGDFDRLQSDFFGFYDYDMDPDWYSIWTQPDAPNIVVPSTGLLDIDIWCGYGPPM